DAETGHGHRQPGDHPGRAEQQRAGEREDPAVRRPHLHRRLGPVREHRPILTSLSTMGRMALDVSPYDAVLLVSFGGPEGPDDVLPFLENVTRGRGIPRE